MSQIISRTENVLKLAQHHKSNVETQDQFVKVFSRCMNNTLINTSGTSLIFYLDNLISLLLYMIMLWSAVKYCFVIWACFCGCGEQSLVFIHHNKVFGIHAVVTSIKEQCRLINLARNNIGAQRMKAKHKKMLRVNILMCLYSLASIYTYTYCLIP